MTQDELEEFLHTFADEIRCSRCNVWFCNKGRTLIDTYNGKEICPRCTLILYSGDHMMFRIDKPRKS